MVFADVVDFLAFVGVFIGADGGYKLKRVAHELDLVPGDRRIGRKIDLPDHSLSVGLRLFREDFTFVRYFPRREDVLRCEVAFAERVVGLLN